jgi:hypothetical protein
MNEYEGKQYECNLKLGIILCELIKEHPEQRFSQILANYEFVRTERSVREETFVMWMNEFYNTSEEILERVTNRMGAQ